MLSIKLDKQCIFGVAVLALFGVAVLALSHHQKSSIVLGLMACPWFDGMFCDKISVLLFQLIVKILPGS